MPVTEIRIAGFGGQGVIMAASVIGKAACLFENGYAAMVQNFGPEARGGACSAGLIVSDEPILYPYVQQPRIFIAFSQEAFAKFRGDISPDGIALVEEDLVDPTGLPPGVQVYTIPATRIAEELGKRMMLNIVMVGFVAAITRVATVDALKKAIHASVPPKSRELNLQAFEAGYAAGASAQSRGAVEKPALLNTP